MSRPNAHMPDDFVEWRKQSPEYRAAVEALFVLSRAEYGTGLVERAAAEVLAQLRYAEEAASARYSRAPDCIEWLESGRVPRSLTSLTLPPRSDHMRSFRDDKGRRVLVSEPYGLGTAALRETVQLADEHDLEVFVDAGYATHFPGRTLYVRFTRRRDEEGP